MLFRPAARESTLLRANATALVLRRARVVDREALARRAAFRCRPRCVPSRRRRSVHQFPRRHLNFSPTRFFGGSKCRVPSCALRLCGGCGGCKSGERVGWAPSVAAAHAEALLGSGIALAAHRCHDETGESR